MAAARRTKATHAELTALVWAYRDACMWIVYQHDAVSGIENAHDRSRLLEQAIATFREEIDALYDQSLIAGQHARRSPTHRAARGTATKQSKGGARGDNRG